MYKRQKAAMNTHTFGFMVLVIHTVFGLSPLVQDFVSELNAFFFSGQEKNYFTAGTEVGSLAAVRA